MSNQWLKEPDLESGIAVDGWGRCPEDRQRQGQSAHGSAFV